MKLISRLFFCLLLVASVAACTSSGVGGGATNGEDIDGTVTLEDLSGQAAAVACTTNADCAGVFEANSCALAACDVIEQHCTAVPKSEGTACAGPAGGCGGVGEGICGANGACEVDPSTVEEAGCDDANPCTTDECHPELGCLYTHVEDGEGCDDGDPCTENGACAEGTCTAEAVPGCEDEPGVSPLEQCLAEACADEWAACMADDACATAAACMIECDKTDGGDACEYECMMALPEDSYGVFEGVGVCGENNGCIEDEGPDGTPPDDPALECIADACPDLGSDCMSDQGCSDAVMCLSACDDDDAACSDECFASIPPMSQLVFFGLVDCAGNSGCVDDGPGDGDDPTLDCLSEECGGELNACTGSQGCMDLITCMEGCPEGDQGCTDACYEDASPKAQNEWWGLVICGSEQGCFEDQPEDPAECLDEQCGDELGDCLGDAGCQGIFACQEDCDEDDSDCSDECVEDASPDSQDVFYSLIICGVENDCFGPGDDDPVGQCLTDECGDSYFDCVLGDPGCVGIFECMEECAEGDQECNDECFDDASSDAQESWTELVECGQDNGCLESPPNPGGEDPPEENPIVECLQDKCPGSFGDCVDDGGCLTISPCLETCDDDDDECKNECFDDAGEESTQKWWAVVNCGVGKGCVDEPGVEPPDGPKPDEVTYQCIMASCDVDDYEDVPDGKEILNCIAACEDALCAEN
ncbi:MAG: hypothetical protein VX938_11470, partial [Myxococcota bacterium]|nr:hypothetical protein [Myxococcota bacterium]